MMTDDTALDTGARAESMQHDDDDSLDGAFRLVPEGLFSLLTERLRNGEWHGALLLSRSQDRISLCRSLWPAIPTEDRADVLAQAIVAGDAPQLEWTWLQDTLDSLHESGDRLFDSDHARSAFDALPDPLTVYRGTVEAEGDQYGVCWTVSPEIARFFAADHARFRNTRSNPVILSTTLPKERVTGFLTDRDESEALVTRTNLADVDRVEITE